MNQFFQGVITGSAITIWIYMTDRTAIDWHLRGKTPMAKIPMKVFVGALLGWPVMRIWMPIRERRDIEESMAQFSRASKNEREASPS